MKLYNEFTKKHKKYQNQCEGVIYNNYADM